MLAHSVSERDVIAIFFVFVGASLIVKGKAQDSFLNESESSPSDLAEPMKATPLLRALVIGAGIAAIAVGLWQLFHRSV
jgi:hypothetical protein